MNIYSNIRFIAEIGGIIAAIAGMGLLFMNEHYTVGLLVILIIIALIYILVRNAFSQPVSYKRVTITIDLVDNSGHEAKLEKKNILIVNEKNVTQLVDRNFSVTGTMEFTGTNIGKMLNPISGGTQSIFTVFPVPLDVGEEIDHRIKYIAWDTFNDQTNSFDFIQQRSISDVEIIVKFPEDRLPKEIRAYIMVRGISKQLNGLPKITDKGRKMYVQMDKVKFGTMIHTEWDW